MAAPPAGGSGGAAATKSHKAAVCLIPAAALWRPIQLLRCFNDKAFVRWMPHINLLYPFLQPTHFPAAAERAARALEGCAPFPVSLRRFSHFEHGPQSSTLWLEPESEGLLRVQQALQAEFPDCDDLSSDPQRGIQAFTPHLSVGQWRGREEAAGAAQRAAASWQPLSFVADSVALIARESHGQPFHIKYVVPLGGGPPQQVDIPYIATVGSSDEEGEMGALDCSPASTSSGGGGGSLADSMLQHFGLGAACASEGGVWNFAYGANMAPSKLGGRRGIHPLQSLPAQLPGWRLCFNHRGGMGNLVRLGPGEAGPAGLRAVHGVLHRLTPNDYAELARCEHEYLPTEVEVAPYGGGPPVRAVAFLTPQARCTRDGLAPTARYLGLLQQGVAHWHLEPAYRAWLQGLQGVEQRGDAYYTSAAGEALAALPKTRVEEVYDSGGEEEATEGGGSVARR